MLPHPKGLGHARGASCPAQPVALGFCRRRAGAVPHQGSACCYNYSPRKSSPRCRTRLSQAALPAWQGAEGFIWFNIYDINYGRVASRSQTPGGLFLRCGDLGESLAVRCWLWAAQGGPRSHPANIPPVSCQQRAGSLPSSTSRDIEGCSCTLRALCMAAGFSSAAEVLPQFPLCLPSNISPFPTVQTQLPAVSPWVGGELGQARSGWFEACLSYLVSAPAPGCGGAVVFSFGDLRFPRLN